MFVLFVVLFPVEVCFFRCDVLELSAYFSLSFELKVGFSLSFKYDKSLVDLIFSLVTDFFLF